MPKNIEKLSELVSRRLQELKISKADLARTMKVSRTYVTDLANGTAKTLSGEYNPSAKHILSLSNHLDVNTDELLKSIAFGNSEK